MYEIASEPQSIGGVLDSGFKLFRACFARIFPFAFVAALVYAPLGLMGAWVATQPTGGRLTVFAVGFIVLLIVAVAVNAAILTRIDAIAHGRDMSVGDALAVGVRRGPVLLLASFCYAFVVLIGLLLLIVPGLIWMVSMVFSPYATVVSPKQGPLASLRYSRELVRGHWWRTAALITIGAIIVTVVYGVLALAAGIIAVMNPEQLAQGTVPWYIDFVVSPLVSGLAMPLGYSLFLATYYDLRLRREGGDIAERIAAATA
jgi:Uncharacterised protein family (UPF0259)